MSLPVTRAVVNGSLINDCLMDTGSQLTLLDSKVFRAVAPLTELRCATNLRSASGHAMTVLGKCDLPVQIISRNGPMKETLFEFLVVEGLSHNCIIGWDFLSSQGAIMNCAH